MIHKQSYKAYAAATQTVAKTKQVIMLYDAAIKYVQHAIDAIEKQDIQTRYNSLTKACDIIFGLQGSLDFDQGGDIAKTLYDFYASLDARLMTVHRNNSPTICKQVMDDLRSMRDAWIEIDKMDDGTAPAIPTPKADSASNGQPQPPEGGVAISA